MVSLRKTVPPLAPSGHRAKTQWPVSSTLFPCGQMHAPIISSPSRHGAGSLQFPSLPSVWPGGQTEVDGDEATDEGVVTGDGSGEAEGAGGAGGGGGGSTTAGGAAGVPAHARRNMAPERADPSSATARRWRTESSSRILSLRTTLAATQ